MLADAGFDAKKLSPWTSFHLFDDPANFFILSGKPGLI
jgi:hypothetical protein